MTTLRVVPVDEATREQRNARRSRLLWVAGAAILMLAITVQPLRDTDVWWHLALGQLITTHGIPAQEPFSFLAAAHPWVGQQWLYEVLLAGLVGAGGAGLASVVMGVVAACALAIAAGAVPRAARVRGPWLAAGVVLSGLAMAQVVGVRGQVISLFGVAVVLYVITRWREGHTAHLWVLPPLFLVWANMHAGFIAGFVILLLALAIARPLQPAARRSRRALALAIAAAALATLLNPAGPGLYAYVAETFNNPTLTQVVTEWMAPDFHNLWVRLFAFEAALLVIAWLAGGGADRMDVVVALGLLVATLQAQRNVSLFAIAAVPQLALYGSRAWELRVAPRLGPRALRLHHLRPALAAVLVAALAGAVAVTIAPQVTPAAAAAFESSRYPTASATYYDAHFHGQRVYAPDVWGGYLAYRFPTGRVVFLYDETAVFGDAALQRYLDIHLVRRGWADVLSQEQIAHAIVGRSSQEASALHELGWTVDCGDSASASLVMSAPSAAAQRDQVVASAQVVPANLAAC